MELVRRPIYTCILVAAIITFAVSCKKEETPSDKQVPITTLSKPDGAAIWYVGTSELVEGTCEDNTALNAFYYALKDPGGVILEEGSMDITGTSTAVAHTFVLDAGLELGKYSLESYCRDGSGNLSATEQRAITMLDTLKPTITLGTKHAEKGMTIDIRASFTSGKVRAIVIQEQATSIVLTTIAENDEFDSLELTVLSDAKLVSGKSFDFTGSVTTYSYLIPFTGYTGSSNRVLFYPEDVSGNRLTTGDSLVID